MNEVIILSLQLHIIHSRIDFHVIYGFIIMFQNYK